MNRYRVKAEPAEGNNPEFSLDKDLVEGIETDGFMLLAMKDGKPHCAVIHQLATLDVARLLAEDKSEIGSVIAQASAIADGMRRAAEIEEKHGKNKVAKDLAGFLKAMSRQ